MRTLYFDIDGTLLSGSEPKRRLAAGTFENAVRAARFQRLVCVSNVGVIVRVLREMGQEPDALGMVYELCRGVFTDEKWFRLAASLAPVPEHRARYIDFTADWWYLDDMACTYLAIEGFDELYRLQNGGRILAPYPDGDGRDVLDWLRGLVSRRPLSA